MKTTSADTAPTAASTGSPSVRALQGAALGVLAPVGWLLIQMVVGSHSPVDSLAADPWLYLYMLVGTMASFSCFGWLVGREEERLARLALQDELTGLYNSRHFNERLKELLKTSHRHGRELSLLTLDLDHFKAINDTHGHPLGDMALRATGLAIRNTVRAGDVPVRVGGEEFAVILPETGLEEATLVGARLLQAIRAVKVRLPDGKFLSLRASIGIAGGPVTLAHTPSALYFKADQALYLAKTKGRDQLAVAGTD